MAQPLSVRVAELERQMLSLHELPGQVADLNRHMRAVEARIGSLAEQFTQLRSEVSAEFSAVRTEFSRLRQEMKDGDEETRRYMRVLHEEVISRIRTLRRG
jgi:predicted  nucleic acid-binding Zn-ribbon protein